MEAILPMTQMMEYYRARKRDLHMVFINLKKAYDRIPREVFRWALTKKSIPKNYINIVQDMYRETKTNIRTYDFPFTIGLHHGSTLYLFLFVEVLDEITHSIRGDVLQSMLFVIDIVLAMRPERQR